MTLQKGDFITLDFTGTITEEDTVFDTTKKDVAQEHGIYEERVDYEPITVCIGEGHVLPGLDKALEGKKEQEETSITLKPEEAFGKKTAEALKLMPKRVFDKQKITPRPGLEVNIDEQRGVIKNVSGNRIIVDFNHPLSGKELTYKITIHKKITETQAQVETIIQMLLRHKADVKVTQNKAVITFPIELPEKIQEQLKTDITRLTSIEEVNFKKSEKNDNA